MAVSLSTHTALAARETLSAVVRAAHACAAMALAAGGTAATDDAWRFAVPAGGVGAMQREVATELLHTHGAADDRVASACSALVPSAGLGARMPIATFMAAFVLMVIVFAFDRPAVSRRRRQTTRVAAMQAAAPKKDDVEPLRRADALMRMAAVPASAPRRGVRARRIGMVCACSGVGPC